MKLKHNIKKFYYWIPAVFWIIVIFIMGSVRIDFNGENINLVSRILFVLKKFLYLRRKTCFFYIFLSENLDRFYHAFEYFILTVFIFYAIKKTRDAVMKENIFLTAMIVISIGILDELHQIFIPTRYCSIYDFLADGIGMLLMVLFLTVFELTIKRQNVI